jgi:hypothetical protein
MPILKPRFMATFSIISTLTHDNSLQDHLFQLSRIRRNAYAGLVAGTKLRWSRMLDRRLTKVFDVEAASREDIRWVADIG